MSNYLKPLTQAQVKCNLKAKYFDYHLATVHSRHPKDNCISHSYQEKTLGKEVSSTTVVNLRGKIHQHSLE